MEKMTVHLILDYIRLLSYGIVIISSLRGIMSRGFSNLLFIGDVLLAVAFIIMRFAYYFGLDSEFMNDVILTPIAIFWAFVHFKSMLKDADGYKKC